MRAAGAIEQDVAVGERAVVIVGLGRGADALVDLDRWERFEAANPRTFIQTYLFYVRSPG